METIRKKKLVKRKKALDLGKPILFSLECQAIVRLTAQVLETEPVIQQMFLNTEQPLQPLLTFHFPVCILYLDVVQHISHSLWSPFINLLSSGAHEPLTRCLACYCSKCDGYSLNNKLCWSKSPENFPNPLSKVLSIIVQRQIELQNPSHGE